MLSKKEGKDQESIQSSTTPDPGYQWESDNVTIRHHKPEPRGPQQVTTRPHQTDVHESITKHDRNNINDPQKKHRLGTVSIKILLECLNRFNGAPTLPLVQMWIKTHRCLVCTKDPLLINASSPRTYKSRYKKEIKSKIRIQQKIKLNTGAKEIQQVNPGGPDNSQSITPLP